jgi:uncharacterized Zn-finger protein
MCNINLPSISKLPLPNLLALQLPPLRVITDQSGKTHYCEYCFKAFNYKNSLKRHLRTHTGIKPYSCNACNKNFSRKDILSRHKESTKCINRSLSLSNSLVFSNSNSIMKSDYPSSPNPLMSITSILSDCSTYLELKYNISPK